MSFAHFPDAYVDAIGDLLTATVLARIVYWYLQLDKHGKPVIQRRLKGDPDNFWLTKTIQELIEETRVTREWKILRGAEGATAAQPDRVQRTWCGWQENRITSGWYAPLGRIASIRGRSWCSTAKGVASLPEHSEGHLVPAAWFKPWPVTVSNCGRSHF